MEKSKDYIDKEENQQTEEAGRKSIKSLSDEKIKNHIWIFFEEYANYFKEVYPEYFDPVINPLLAYPFEVDIYVSLDGWFIALIFKYNELGIKFKIKRMNLSPKQISKILLPNLQCDVDSWEDKYNEKIPGVLFPVKGVTPSVLYSPNLFSINREEIRKFVQIYADNCVRAFKLDKTLIKTKENIEKDAKSLELGPKQYKEFIERIDKNFEELANKIECISRTQGYPQIIFQNQNRVDIDIDIQNKILIENILPEIHRQIEEIEKIIQIEKTSNKEEILRIINQILSEKNPKKSWLATKISDLVKLSSDISAIQGGIEALKALLRGLGVSI